MAPIEIYNYSDRHSCFSCRDRNDKNGKEKSVHPVWPEIFIKSNKIQVHAVQYQFYAHQHCDQVSPGEETEHADKEQCCTDE